MSVQQLISKPYAPIMEIIEVYGIAFETADVHQMLSERGYPKIRKSKKAPAATEA